VILTLKLEGFLADEDWLLRFVFNTSEFYLLNPVSKTCHVENIFSSSKYFNRPEFIEVPEWGLFYYT